MSRADRLTDGRTDIASYRDARMYQKKKHKYSRILFHGVDGRMDARYSEPECAPNYAAERQIHVNGSGHLLFGPDEHIGIKGAYRLAEMTPPLYPKGYVSEFLIVGDRELEWIVFGPSESSNGD